MTEVLGRRRENQEVLKLGSGFRESNAVGEWVVQT